MACAVASVSCQGFYAWQRHCLAPPCATDLGEAEFVGEVRRTSGDFGSTYGLPLGVTTGEVARRGRCVNHKRPECTTAPHSPATAPEPSATPSPCRLWRCPNNCADR